MLPNEENVVRSSKIHLVTNRNFHVSHIKHLLCPPKLALSFISLGTTVMPRRKKKMLCKVLGGKKLYDNGRCANGECITTVVKRSVLFSAGRLLK